jgi:excinuclease ABC subunit C
MSLDKLKKQTKKFPPTSGVYLMNNSRGKVIYIGKAANLRARVKNYFQKILPAKLLSLMQETFSINYRKTESDLDALLLEARLIRELQPKYNNRLTDDKTFPLLAISQEPFARVFITRERGRKAIDYYGPFINRTDLHNAIRVLQRIFRFRTCKYKIFPTAEHKYKSCLLSHIKLCSAPCLGKISQKEYQETIDSLKTFLSEHKVELIKRLEILMNKASKQLEYENACLYRDQLNAVKNIAETGKLGPFYEEPLLAETPSEKLHSLETVLGLPHLSRIEAVDISDIKGTQSVGSVVVFIDGEPVHHLYRRFKIKYTQEGKPDDYSRIKEVVYRRFLRLSQSATGVDLLLIDGGRGHINKVLEIFDTLKITPPVMVGLAKAKKIETVYLLKDSVIKKFRMMDKLRLLGYIRDEAHRFAQKYFHFRKTREYAIRIK